MSSVAIAQRGRKDFSNGRSLPGLWRMGFGCMKREGSALWIKVSVKRIGGGFYIIEGPGRDNDALWLVLT